MTLRAISISLAAATAALCLTIGPAYAQNSMCNQFPRGEQRMSCYQRDDQMYRQQAQRADEDYRRARQQHEDVGRALRYAPGGQVWAPTWNAPRRAQDASDYIRTPRSYREDQRRQEEWRRRNR
jgi:hypothetical protein